MRDDNPIKANPPSTRPIFEKHAAPQEKKEIGGKSGKGSKRRGKKSGGGAAPFSLRLTPRERIELEEAAVGMTIAAYVRLRIFGDSIPQRRTRGKAPVKDHEALGRVLGALGKSRLANNLNQLAHAANTGSLPVTPETETAIIQAADDIRIMRVELVRALGLQGDEKPPSGRGSAPHNGRAPAP